MYFWSKRNDCTPGVRRRSLEHMQAVDLTEIYKPTSGDVLARGPGWVRRVWIDTGSGLPGFQGPQAAAAAPPEKPAEHLAYLGIDFQGRLTGNQQRQMMDFYDKVRCVYGPVPDWDTILEPDDPDKLVVQTKRHVLLTSDSLQVVQTQAGADERNDTAVRDAGHRQCQA